MSKTIIATNWHEMVSAQQSLTDWAVARLDAEKASYQDLEYVRDRLVTGDFSTKRIDGQIAQCRRRITFYAKVLAALRHGYTIVPSMVSQVFAVKGPQKPTRGWKRYQHKTDLPVRAYEIGQGDYTNPEPFTEARVVGQNKHGFDIRQYRAIEFDDVEFPVEAQRPEIIEKVTAAMKTKIFDAIGIVRSAGGDPLIMGHLKTPRSYASDTMFLIAYFIDPDTI